MLSSEVQKDGQAIYFFVTKSTQKNGETTCGLNQIWQSLQYTLAFILCFTCTVENGKKCLQHFRTSIGSRWVHYSVRVWTYSQWTFTYSLKLVTVWTITFTSDWPLKNQKKTLKTHCICKKNQRFLRCRFCLQTNSGTKQRLSKVLHRQYHFVRYYDPLLFNNSLQTITL